MRVSAPWQRGTRPMRDAHGRSAQRIHTGRAGLKPQPRRPTDATTPTLLMVAHRHLGHFGNCSLHAPDPPPRRKVARQAQAAARYNIVIEHMWHERKNTFSVDRTTAFFIFSVFILSPDASRAAHGSISFLPQCYRPIFGPMLIRKPCSRPRGTARNAQSHTGCGATPPSSPRSLKHDTTVDRQRNTSLK